jgi:rod shape-determining protein MreC
VPAGSLNVLDARRRGGAGYLFLLVVVAHLVLISAQVTTKRGTPVLQAVAFGIVAQVQRAGASVVHGVTGMWTGYADLRSVKADNEALTRELTAVRIRLQQERARAEESRELRRLLDLRTRADVQTTAAEVIASTTSPGFRTITIGKGTADGLRPDMAVIGPAGVIGRVIVPSAHAAKVQLLIDGQAAAGALVERSRAQGVVMGAGDGRLQLDYLSSTADVRPGDTVVTSGIDGIYPKGFVIGRIEHVERLGGSYKPITVKPAVDFSSVETVLVVVTPPAAVEARAAEGVAK